MKKQNLMHYSICGLLLVGSNKKKEVKEQENTLYLEVKNKKEVKEQENSKYFASSWSIIKRTSLCEISSQSTIMPRPSFFSPQI